jgi:uncharacterized protein (TIGR02444 family)
MTETSANPSMENPFWRFSLKFYRQEGVSDACIALQDGCGVDVNLLLFLFWLASAGRQLSSSDVKRLDSEVGTWRDRTIVPIRNIRRALKGATTLVEPGKQEAFRTKVKAVELEAERLQQEALYEATQRGALGIEAAPPTAARANVAAYAGALGVSLPRHATDLLLGAFDTLAS